MGFEPMWADPCDHPGYGCFSEVCHCWSHWAVVCDPRAESDDDPDDGNLFTHRHRSLADLISCPLTGERIAVVDVGGAA